MLSQCFSLDVGVLHVILGIILMTDMLAGHSSKVFVTCMFSLVVGIIQAIVGILIIVILIVGWYLNHCHLNHCHLNRLLVSWLA